MDNRKIYRMLVASPFLLLLLLIVYCFYTGRGQHRKPTHEELDQALLRYMQSKYAIYEDTFMIDKPGDEVWASSDLFYPSTGKYELELESKKYSKQRMGEKVVLRYNFEENTLRDTYMSFILYDQVEEKFREIFDQVYDSGSYELVVSVPNVAGKKEDFQAVTTLDEYLGKMTDIDLRICVSRDVELRDEDMNKLLNLLMEYKIGMDADIYYLTDRQFNSPMRKSKWVDTQDFDYEECGMVVWWKGDEKYRHYLWEKDANKNEQGL